MRYIEFKESNNTIDIGGDINVIDIYTSQATLITCLKLNKEEIEQVINTGIIYIKQDIHKDIPTTLIHDTILKEDMGFKDDVTAN